MSEFDWHINLHCMALQNKHVHCSVYGNLNFVSWVLEGEDPNIV